MTREIDHLGSHMDIESAVDIGSRGQLYASPRKPWPPMEALDGKMGAVTGKPCNGALSVCPHNPTVPGSIPGGPTSRSFRPTGESKSRRRRARVFNPKFLWLAYLI